jgi:hypothetical protein
MLLNPVSPIEVAVTEETGHVTSDEQFLNMQLQHRVPDAAEMENDETVVSAVHPSNMQLQASETVMENVALAPPIDGAATSEVHPENICW